MTACSLTPSSADPADSDAVALDRGIGRAGLVALTINCVVGAGILGLPGRVYALAGPSIWLALTAAAALALAAALCLADLATRFEAPGGPVEYCRAAFGQGADFAIGWLLWTATVLAAASLLNLLAQIASPTNRIPILLMTGLALTGLTMIGVRASAGASAALTIGKLVLLAWLAVAGLLAAPEPAIPPLAHPALGPAIVLLFFAFVGFERPTALAGEAIGTRRAMPAALIGGMIAVAAVYAALFAACLRGVPDLAVRSDPLQALATRVMGVSGGNVVGASAAMIVLGTLVSQWITAPRLLLALALDGSLPPTFASLSPRRQTPDLAILATGVAATLLALGGDFVSGLAASSASRLLIFVACGAAILRLRRPGETTSRLRQHAMPAVAIGVMIASAVLLVSAAAELLRLTIILCIGGLLWLSTILTRRHSTRSA